MPVKKNNRFMERQRHIAEDRLLRKTSGVRGDLGRAPHHSHSPAAASGTTGVWQALMSVVKPAYAAASKRVREKESGEGRGHASTAKPQRQRSTGKERTPPATQHERTSFMEHRVSLSSWALLMACLVVGSVAQIYQISTVFEQRTNFSRLPEESRELILGTEVSFYYNYYKVLVESPDFIAGLRKLGVDNSTEFPSTINAMRRFCIHSEVIIASMYRLSTALGLTWEQCSVVKSSEHQQAQVCVGSKTPSYFYIRSVWALAALAVCAMFLLGESLSDGSSLGGVLVLAAYFFNQAEGTEVMWAPGVRDNFGHPIFLTQLFFLTYLLRDPHIQHLPRKYLPLFLSTTLFLLSCLIAQHILLTQCSVLLNLLLSGGSQQLVSSPLFCALLVLILQRITLDSIISELKFPALISMFRASLLLVGVVGLKLEMHNWLGVQEETFLLPWALGALLLGVIRSFRFKFLDPAFAYHVLQCCMFVALAISMTRFKFFLTVQLCLLVSMWASPWNFSFVRSRSLHLSALAVVVALMSVQGLKNIQQQHEVATVDPDPSLEDMLMWIRHRSPPDAVFGGSMLYMPQVRLLGKRPIMNHGFADTIEMRSRIRMIYQLYSRHPMQRVHQSLKNGTTGSAHFVLDASTCLGLSDRSVSDMWDTLEPQHIGRPALCPFLFEGNPAPFKRVFKNDVFAVVSL
ncbi:unnamed protein product [Cyprideis torosa]|uniref:Uncharacterized protein n=1 Tax=Cyprideis torosa TaxID=163714 RepID=A0A7R8WKT9_9CRUS|nr:unnamed protein product [Cyprideis torosa]CAG0897286.1 unnamed protein product [Cyprideis torosa]